MDVDDSRFAAKVAAAESAASRAAGGIESAGRQGFSGFASQASSAFDQVAGGLGKILTVSTVVAAGIAAGLGAAAKSSFDFLTSVQQSTLALKAYTGSAETAGAITKDLIAFAKSDAGVLFNRKDLLFAAQSLAGFGDAAGNVTEHVKIMARAVATGNTTFQELAPILGRIGAAGKLTSTDFDVLTNRGIILDKSMRGASVTFDQLFAAISNAIPADILTQQASTVQGGIIRLQSSFRNLGDELLGVTYDNPINKLGADFLPGGLGDVITKGMQAVTRAFTSPEVKGGIASFGSQVSDLASRIIPLVGPAVEFVARHLDDFAAGLAILAGAFGIATVAARAFAIAAALSQAAGGPLLLLAAGLTFLATAAGVVIVKSGLLQPLMDSLKVVFDSLRPSLEVLGNSLLKAGQVMSTAFQAAGPQINQAFQAIGDSIGKVIQALSPIIPQLAQSFADLMVALLPLAPAFADLISQVITALLPYLPGLTSAFVELVRALVPLVLTIMPPLIELFRQFGPLIMTEIVVTLQLLTGLVKAVTFGFMFMESAVLAFAIQVAKIGVAFGLVNPEVVTQLQTMKTNVDLGMAAVRASADAESRNTTQTVQSHFANLPADVQAAISNLPPNVKATLLSTKAGSTAEAQQTVDQVVGHFKRTPGEAGKAVGPTGAAVSGALSNVPDAGSRAGSGLAKSFGDAIRSGTPWPIAAVEAMVKAVKDRLPHSDAKVGPLSTLTAQGRALPETFAKGIRQTSYVASQAVGEMVSGVGFGSSPSMGVDVSKSGFSEGGRTTVNHVTIEQSGIMTDSRQGIRRVFREGIEAVNEDLRARGVPEIGSGRLLAQQHNA